MSTTVSETAFKTYYWNLITQVLSLEWLPISHSGKSPVLSSAGSYCMTQPCLLSSFILSPFLLSVHSAIFWFLSSGIHSTLQHWLVNSFPPSAAGLSSLHQLSPHTHLLLGITPICASPFEMFIPCMMTDSHSPIRIWAWSSEQPFICLVGDNRPRVSRGSDIIFNVH